MSSTNAAEHAKEASTTNMAENTTKTSTSNVAEPTTITSTANAAEHEAKAVSTPKAAEHDTTAPPSSVEEHVLEASTANMAKKAINSFPSTYDVLLVKLTPAKPIDSVRFLAVLEQLTIVAYDLAVENSTTGVEIGRACGVVTAPTASTFPQGLPSPPLTVSTTNVTPPTDLVIPGASESFILSQGIMQEFGSVQVIQGKSTVSQPVLFSAATAVILVNPLARNTVNLRCEFALSGQLVGTTTDYNVNVVKSMDLGSDPQKLFDLAPSTYFSLPTKVPGPGALQLSSDGTPPNFDLLCAAINIALDQDASDDPSCKTHIESRKTPFTAAESTLIASTIAWNRALYPPPDQPAKLTLMYTNFPDISISDEDPKQVQNDRSQFESNLQSYYNGRSADTTSLAKFVFAASAAICCENNTSTACLAGLTFPVKTPRSTKGSAILTHTSVVLKYPDGAQTATDRFIVPAAYFYALGASYPTQISLEQRYKAALTTTEDQLCDAFQRNVAAGNLASLVAPVAAPRTATEAVKIISKGAAVAKVTAGNINLYQAARRLVALGSTSGTKVDVNCVTEDSVTGGNDPNPKSGSDSTPKSALVDDWLAWTGETTTIDKDFWKTKVDAYPKSYLRLLLQAITEGVEGLVDKIETKIPVATLSDLVKTTPTQWTCFFQKHQDLLPDFTLPGNLQQRVQAFIQRLGKFFDGVADSSGSHPGGQTTILDLPPGNVLQQFLEAYAKIYKEQPKSAAEDQSNKQYSFQGGNDADIVEEALASVYPRDEEARAWLKDAIEIVSFLYKITPKDSKELQFALMEALYARGFTHSERIRGLTCDQFRRALFGTIAYDEDTAQSIYTEATKSDHSQLRTVGDRECVFMPVNSDGSLTNCLPPPNLSPLGATAYLHEILTIPLGGKTLGNLVAGRRGPLQDLRSSMANLSATLPCIDLVNESLEALGNQPSAPQGAVYDTNNHSSILSPTSDLSGSPPLDAVPEHSSPSKSDNSTVYDTLKSCFTDPHLPYAQGIDICSSNLEVLGTNRYETMRHFRSDITELAFDANGEPEGFQRHLWRYPVRFEIGLQYLNITHEEYTNLFSGVKTDKDFLESVLGLTSEVLQPAFFTVAKFLKVTCLTYREFLDLWKCDYVPFERAAVGIKGQAVNKFPDGDMCDLSSIRISFKGPDDTLPLALRKIFVFVRLWRSLHHSDACKTGFDAIAKICNGLQLFKDNHINPDFVRQLASLMMLQNHFNSASEKSPAKGHQDSSSLMKTDSLLAIWTAAGHTSGEWDRAVELLLDSVQEYSKTRYACRSRGLGFRKDLKDNLSQLSLLAGFTDVDSWFAKPTSTIRFVEVLSKIHASEFSVGEIIFLFTAGDHLVGDDPLPLPDALKSAVTLLNFPEEDHSIWELRHKLMNATPEGSSYESWGWREIELALRELGYDPGAQDNALKYLGEHFFHGALEACGYTVHPRARRFEVELPPTDTTVTLWNEECGPFRYDADGTGSLWVELPMCDKSVIEELKNTRQLSQKEIEAVQSLYFAPRAALAPFALIFENFPAAVDKLIREPSKEERFSFFRQQFALFYRRCEIIAEHLGKHVATATSNKNFEAQKVAWHVLASVSADENYPQGQPWESDSGAPPQDYTWEKHLSGSAFAALLGLTGTGLLGQYEVQTEKGDTKVWREVTGDLTFFGDDQNKENVPIPTILPALNFKPLPKGHVATGAINGFAMRDRDEQLLGGAQPFRVCWSGALLIDTAGEYSFCVGHPRPGTENPGSDDTKHQRWLVTLGWGQKSWTIINHCWEAPEARSASSDPLWLHRGVYHIEINFEQRQPLAAGHRRLPTGFQVKYKGPDTQHNLCVVPSAKLFRESKRETLGHGLELHSSALHFLNRHYSSSLRDIRRTYQRAFKGILFASRYGLSVQPFHHDRHGVSELYYMLHHPESFVGASYYRPASSEIKVKTHQAFFDLNFLPVADPYVAPPISEDDRGHPSPQRQAALFDWWERMCDYSQLRRWVRDVRSRNCWVLFYEAMEQAPPADKLLRYLGISANLVPLVINYFGASDTSYSISTLDLTDERWALRVWHAGFWLEKVKKHFLSQHLEQALPWLWSSDDPNLVISNTSGNGNLRSIVEKGLLDRPSPGVEDMTALNNGLRFRARQALLAYLCGNNRILLPFKDHTFATVPRDLSDLLLQDIEVGIDEKSTRIDDAISSVQTFVQRVRLGLESGIHATPDFIRSWDTKYSTLKAWETSKRREIYPENWIHWEELQSARKSEAFRSLEKQLQRGVLTVPKPGASLSWAGTQLPEDGHLADLQSLELFSLSVSDPSTTSSMTSSQAPMRSTNPKITSTVSKSNDADSKMTCVKSDFGTELSWLLALPEHDGQLSMVAPIPTPPPESTTVGTTDGITTQQLAKPSKDQVPLWMSAAVKMGANFKRVAAASGAVATSRPGLPARLCSTCQEVHAQNVDEYYFWLTPAREFSWKDAQQDLNLGSTPPDPSCDWDPDRNKLKTLLQWNSQAIYYLNWCRVHFGKFDTPRQSDRGVIGAGNSPTLGFLGRKGNFLLFSVNELGTFRYDMSEDWAQVVVHDLTVTKDEASNEWQAAEDLIDTSNYPQPLMAFPSFILFEPGVPLIPPSNFSTALSIASALSSHGHFEASLKWYELAFDSPRSPLSRDNSWEQPGFETAKTQPDQSTSPNDTSPAVTRERAVLLDYLEALLQWGDDLFCKGTSESNRQALVIFNLINQIVGTCPPSVRLEDSLSNSTTIGSFVPAALPLNPRLMALYDGVANSLAKLHQSDRAMVKKNGAIHKRRDGYPFLHSPHRRPPYRFSYLLAKASDLAGLVRSLADSLLSALEKGDSEYLAALQAMHSKQVTSLSLESGQHGFRAADWDVQSLQQSLMKSMCELNYNQTLIRNGLNANENSFLQNTQLAIQERAGGQTSLTAAEAASMEPDVYAGGAGLAGSPMNFEKITGGSDFAMFFHFAGEILNSQSDQSNTTANMALTQSGWDRRLDDWMHQVDIVTIELKELEAQKLAADRRRHIALHELNNTQRQIEHAIEVQNFMRDKTTNFDLYLFLQRETAIRYRQIYDMALCAAREAQEMFYYERRNAMHDFLAECTWSNLHEGLAASDQLSLALQAMDRAYTETNVREYELTKFISLNMHLPSAFLALKATGSCEFAIPEWFFDLDYPGHYLRRIKSVSLTIPCVVGPYTGIHARLELLDSSIRVSPLLTDLDGANDCAPAPRDLAKLYQCRSLTEDERFTHHYGTREAIATSTGLSDSGLFELNMGDERYLPFEYAGAVSRWRLQLPPENNAFELDSLTDVVIQVNYTAREGGEVLRKAADESTRRRLPADGWRLFDIRREFADAWALLERGMREGVKGRKDTDDLKPHRKPTSPKLRLLMNRNMFPFLTGRRIVTVVRLQLFIQPEDPSQPVGSHIKLKYYPAGHAYRDDDDDDDDDDEEDQDQPGLDEFHYAPRIHSFDCVSHSEWPGMYHGVIDVEIEVPPADAHGVNREVGSFKFPPGLGRLREAYVLCQYQAKERGGASISAAAGARRTREITY